jgi:hypothetical protein
MIAPVGQTPHFAPPTIARDGAPSQSAPPAQANYYNGYSNGAWEVSRLVPNQDHQARLFRWGINNPGKLRFWGGGPVRRFFTGMFTGIPDRVLRAYAQEGDM